MIVTFRRDRGGVESLRPGGHTRSSRSARNVGTCNGARVVFGRFGRNRTTAKGKIVTYGVCQKRASQSASGPRPIIAAKRNAPARLRARARARPL